VPADLVRHACLRQRSPASGKLNDWPLLDVAGNERTAVPETMSATTIEPLIHLNRVWFESGRFCVAALRAEVVEETWCSPT
jgi:hypothetical protein